GLGAGSTGGYSKLALRTQLRCAALRLKCDGPREIRARAVGERALAAEMIDASTIDMLCMSCDDRRGGVARRDGDDSRRSPIAGNPHPVPSIVAIDPGIAEAGAGGTHNSNWRWNADSDSYANCRGGEQSAGQKHRRSL